MQPQRYGGETWKSGGHAGRRSGGVVAWKEIACSGGVARSGGGRKL
jgi:hypothetical protein